MAFPGSRQNVQMYHVTQTHCCQERNPSLHWLCPISQSCPILQRRTPPTVDQGEASHAMPGVTTIMRSSNPNCSSLPYGYMSMHVTKFAKVRRACLWIQGAWW